MMKLHDVLLKATAKKITLWNAAEIVDVCDRTMRRWPEQLEEGGYSGLAGRRRSKASEKRVTLCSLGEGGGLHQENYYDVNIRHCDWPGPTGIEPANLFLREHYIAEFNEKFTVAAAEKGPAFRRTWRVDIGWVFTVQPSAWWIMTIPWLYRIGLGNWKRADSVSSLAGCTVTIHEHLSDEIPIRYGPHLMVDTGRDSDRAHPQPPAKKKKLWKRRARGSGGKPQTGFPPLPPSLGNPAKAAGFPLSHSSDDRCYLL